MRLQVELSDADTIFMLDGVELYRVDITSYLADDDASNEASSAVESTETRGRRLSFEELRSSPFQQREHYVRIEGDGVPDSIYDVDLTNDLAGNVKGLSVVRWDENDNSSIFIAEFGVDRNDDDRLEFTTRVSFDLLSSDLNRNS